MYKKGIKIYRKQDVLINKKRVYIRYRFNEDEFSYKNLKRSFENYVKWRKGEKSKGGFLQPPPKLHISEKILNNAKIPSFEEFKKITYRKISPLIVRCLKDMPDVITSNPFFINVSFDMGMWKGTINMGIIYEEKCNLKSIYLGINCNELVGRIIAPYVLEHKTFPQAIVKMLWHEFHHQRQILRTKKEWQKYKRLEREYKKGLIGYSKLKLFYCFWELMKEAEAQLVETRSLNRRTYDTRWNIYFRRNLMRIAKSPNPKKIDCIYDRCIENITQLYFCGLLMCLTILFAIAKKENEESKIKLFKKNGEKIKLSDWDKVMTDEKVFVLGNPPNKFVNKTLSLTKELDYKDFIKKYEDAAKVLGIDEKNLVLTMKQINGLYHTAQEYFDSHRKK